MGKLDNLSSEKSKAQSKNDSKKQKKMFRQLISAIEVSTSLLSLFFISSFNYSHDVDGQDRHLSV